MHIKNVYKKDPCKKVQMFINESKLLHVNEQHNFFYMKFK